MTPPLKPHLVDFNHHLLFPTNIFDRLSEEHESYLYRDLLTNWNHQC